MTAFAIDFGAANGGNSFQGVVRRGIPGYAVTRLGPPGLKGKPAVGLSTAAYVDHYARMIEESGAAPTALLGYCAGGLFTRELGARLRAEGLRPGPVVLLDTVGTGPRHVADEFARNLRDLGWSEEAAFGVDLPLARETALSLLAEDLANGLTFLEQAVTQFVTGFMSAHGVDDAMAAQLIKSTITRISSCLRYIAASTVRTDSQPDDSTHVIVSRSLAAAAEAFWAPTGARVHVVECEHHEMLHFEATYQSLLDRLGVKSLLESGG
jgi:thioesterase domain-containing protein